MADTITLTRDYGYDEYRASNLDSTIIDASDASWIVSNMGDDTNLYPVLVRDSSDITLLDGTISGEVSLTLDWKDAYVNSAALFVKDSDNVEISGWKITQAWDAIRLRGGEGDEFTIDNVWLKDIRDDAIENDQGLSGTISNSLFEDVFVGISTADRNMSNQSDEVVTIDNVLIGMKSYMYKGNYTHMSPFKVYDTSPQMKIYDTVIAIEDPTHHGFAALERAWAKTVDASGNYLLNLSDEPLPSNYPTPPEGFTILQGAEARAFWEDAKADWIEDFEGDGSDEVTIVENAEVIGDDTAPVDADVPEQEPASPPVNETLEDGETISDESTASATEGGDDTSPPPADYAYGDEGGTEFHGTSGKDKLIGDNGSNTLFGYSGRDTLLGKSGDDMLIGGKGNDVLIGHEGDDILRGQDGDDRLVGRSGADILVGGRGDDSFRIDRLDHSSVDEPDIIRAGDGALAFEGVGEKGGDRIDLRGLDANEGARGNQSFTFGSTGKGGISLVDLEDGTTMLVGNTNGDDEYEFSLIIEDGDISASDYSEHDFML